MTEDSLEYTDATPRVKYSGEEIIVLQGANDQSERPFVSDNASSLSMGRSSFRGPRTTISNNSGLGQIGKPRALQNKGF